MYLSTLGDYLALAYAFIKGWLFC